MRPTAGHVQVVEGPTDPGPDRVVDLTICDRFNLAAKTLTGLTGPNGLRYGGQVNAG